MILASLFVLLAQAAAGSETPLYDVHVDATPEHEAPKVVVLCDPTAYRFSIRATANAASLDRGYPQRKVIDVERDLFQWLPGWTGAEEIRGPLIRYVRCGPYTVQLRGNAYNLNVQGEAGAYSGFAEVTLLRADRMIHNSLRLVECERDLPRARPCPVGYAVRIDGWYDREKKVLRLVETASSAGESATARQTETRRFEIGDDLDIWHPSEALRSGASSKPKALIPRRRL